MTGFSDAMDILHAWFNFDKESYLERFSHMVSLTGWSSLQASAKLYTVVSRHEYNNIIIYISNYGTWCLFTIPDEMGMGPRKWRGL